MHANFECISCLLKLWETKIAWKQGRDHIYSVDNHMLMFRMLYLGSCKFVLGTYVKLWKENIMIAVDTGGS